MHSLWVEIEYTVTITEKGTAILKIEDVDLSSGEAVLKQARAVANKKQTTVISDSEAMKMDGTAVKQTIVKFYLDDEGRPMTACPISKETIEGFADSGDFAN